MKRDWTDALAKVRAEGRCRVCGSREMVQAAHIIGRSYDPPDGRVRAVDVIPLCGLWCHPEYDAHRLNILPVTRPDEEGAAVGHVGLDRALRRMSSGRCIIVERPDGRM